MTLSRKVFVIGLLVALAAFVGWVIRHETRTPQNQAEVMNRIFELEKEGRYEKAVEVAENWMNDGRRNSTHERMYDEIALAYIMKAYKRPASRDESIRRAEENLEKELSFFDKQNHGELSLDLFEVGRSYETLGDLSDKDKCHFYEKASQALMRQLPLIQGDSYTAYGHTTPLEPVRGDVRKHLNAVNEKSAKAGCVLPPEQ